MKKLLFLLLLLPMLSIGQIFHHNDSIINTRIFGGFYLSLDTLVIMSGYSYKYIKIGSTVYKIIVPSPFLEEIKPQTFFSPKNGFILFDTANISNIINTSLDSISTKHWYLNK